MNQKTKSGLIHAVALHAVALSVGAVAMAGTGAAQAAPKPKIAWQKSFEGALAQAKRSGKPVFVDFYATWCGPCKILDAKVFPDARVVRASRSYVAVKVDGDKRPDLIKKYGITGFPTLGFLSPSGQVLKLQTGFAVPPSGDPFKAVAADLARTMNSLRARRSTMALR